MNENHQSIEKLHLPSKLSNRYRLIKPIGEGANGVTWLAVDPEGNKVAIKSLRLAMSEDLKSFELFRREAEVLRSINVNGVPKFYESYLSDEHGGACFIIQEYIEAPSIHEMLLEIKQFSEQDTLKIMYQTAKILESLHFDYVPSVIHRDIKPSNILCQQDPVTKEYRVWLIDFGAVANPQTRSGGSTIAGTHGYMAPEQLLGECSTSSDFFALGASALEMLTEVEPWRLESNGFALDFEKILSEKAPNTSKNMKQLLKILLAPRAEDRPANAKVLRKMILSVMMGHAPNAQETKKDNKVGNFIKRLFAKKTKKALTAGKSWISVKGIIRHIDRNYIYYTFKAKDNEHYEGVCRNYTLQTTPTIQTNLECIVQYNPRNPMFNKLLEH